MTTALAVSFAGVLLSLLAAWGVASKGFGRMEGRVDALEKDVERLDKDKASAVALEALGALLTRIDADMKAGLADIKAEIRMATRHLFGRGADE
jgi:hypothetical protein